MSRFVLRVEAGDFENTLFDMSSISAIRGASLGYLYSPRLVERVLDQFLPKQYEAIFTGASLGAWILDANEADAIKAAQAVRTAFGRSDLGGSSPTGPHEHLAYVVALVPGDDLRALTRAEALNGLEMRQGEGFPLPAFDPSTDQYDSEGDRARPASVIENLPVGPTRISHAHRDRRRFGRDQRQRFYVDFGGASALHGFDFCDDFESMVKDPPDVALSLRSKVGVFFADGNRFARHRQKATAANGLVGLRKFSQLIGEGQRDLLQSILGWLVDGAKANPDAFLSGGSLRFETLMWGGDELLFVMPSWLALEFAEKFFQWIEGWKSAFGDPLTFSAGLVICNRKTPVRQSKGIAGQLADTSKQLQPKAGGLDAGIASDNFLQMEVFESLSLPETGFDAFREQLYFARNVATDDQERLRERRGLDRQLAIRGTDTGGLVKRISMLKSTENGLPRSQLYKLLKAGIEQGASKRGTVQAAKHQEVKGETAQPAAVTNASAELEHAYEAYLDRAGEDKAPPRAALNVLSYAEGAGYPKPPLALNLAVASMLWDYVAPLPGEDA